MDFDKSAERQMNGLCYYDYERLDPSLLPSIYIAYHNALSEPTEAFHNDIRGRFDCGEPLVVETMQRIGRLAEEGREALLAGNTQQLSSLIDKNFDGRSSIYNLAPWQVKMVETARGCGASAKFAGSGGAIIGVYQGEEMYESLKARMADIGSITIKPTVTPKVE